MSASLRQGFHLGDYLVHPPSGSISGPGGTHHAATDTMTALLYLAEHAGQRLSARRLTEAIWHGDEHADAALLQTIDTLRELFGDDDNASRYIEVLGDGAYRLLKSPTPLERDRDDSVTGNSGERQSPAAGGNWQRFVDELKRRRVVRVGLVYVVVAWLIIQVAEATFPALLLPDWSLTLVVILMVLGFPLAVMLAWAYQVQPEGAHHSATALQIVVDKNRKMDFVVMAALTAVVISLAYELYVREAPIPATEPAATTDSVDASASAADQAIQDVVDLPAIAVLQFDNFTGDPANQDIADGIVEELLTELVRISELRVVGRKASFYYSDKSESWPTIAQNLGASLLIEGSIRKSDDTIRVMAQLIDDKGIHLWTKPYDTSIDGPIDVLDMQRQIAQTVVQEMPITLSEKSRRELQRVPTRNEQAYAEYLQGRTLLRKGGQMEVFKDAEARFREALSIDPDFVDALAGLCDAQLQVYQRSLRPQDYARAASNCTRLTTEDAQSVEGFVALGTLNRLTGNDEEAKLLFEQALALSPAHEPALYGLARAVEGLGNYADAEQYYQQSELLDPGYWAVYLGYGRYLERGGRTDEAIAKYQEAIRLAPDNIDGYTNLGAAYMDNDQWDEAAAAWQQGLEIEATPIGHLNLGTVEYYRGNYALAADHFRDGIYLWSEFYPLWGKLGAALERLGQREESQSSFENAANYAEAAIEINAKDARAMYYLASYLAHLGRYAEAARWSREALELTPDDAAAHYFAAVVASLSGNDAAAIDSLGNALQRGYSARIIRHDPYFQPYLESDRLAAWLQEDQ